jgi:hypothetical protein
VKNKGSILKKIIKNCFKRKEKTVLPLRFELTIICLKGLFIHKVKEAGNLKFMKFSNSVKLCKANIISGLMRRFLAGDFNILVRNIYEIWAKSIKNSNFSIPPGTLKVGQMAPLFGL